MRNVFFAVALMVLFTGTSFAQAPPPMLAVERCTINPGEGQEAGQALRALGAHVTSSSEQLPGTLYGVFREILEPESYVTFILEVEGLGEFQEFIQARGRANNSDERRGTLFRAWRSHLNAESCNWSFQLRMVQPPQ